MLVKLLILFMLMSSNCFAGIGKVVTQEQLDKLCVGVGLTKDMSVHYFYYKSIINFDNDGMTVKGSKTTFYPKDEITNFDEAFDKWSMLEKIKP